MNLQAPLKLDLTVEEVNGILAALNELPTKTNAFLLIQKIHMQAAPQIPKEEAPAEEPKTE